MQKYNWTVTNLTCKIKPKDENLGHYILFHPLIDLHSVILRGINCMLNADCKRTRSDQMIRPDKLIYKKYMADEQGYQMCLEPLSGSLVNLQYA